MDPVAPVGSSAEAMVARVAGGVRASAADRIAVEMPIAFVYNGESYTVMMASPGDLEDFAIGFSVAEGIVAAAGEIGPVGAEIQGPGLSLSIAIPEARAAALAGRRRNVAGRTGCGLCGLAEIGAVLRPLARLPRTAPIAAAAIDRAIAGLPAHQVLNRETGAIHAAGFATREGELLAVREDVGRHNALDKLIGAVLRRGLAPADGIVVTTSRCSMEMVQKTASFGCPVLATVSAPTSLAIELAEDCGMTVAAFARGAGFNLYTHPERIA
jgi:FdhD protein